jgi:glucokinase
MTEVRDEGRGLCLGIEIGGTKLQLSAGKGGGITERIIFPVDRAAGGAGIRSQLEKTVPELARRVKPSAVGAGFGGPVDRTTGRICCSHQIEGWSDFPLAAWLSELAGAPAEVDNDANVAALGEALHGAGRAFKLVFYVTLGSGVGGGLVRHGAIYHGATPGESEVGHLRLNRAGTTVESRCSGWAVDARLRAAALENPRGPLARCLAGATGHEAARLAPALAAGDQQARQILDETADDLAFGLSHVTHLFHPEVIMLGGGLALVGEPLRAAVETSLHRYVMAAFAPGPRVMLSNLREDAVLAGALSLAGGMGKVR